MIKVFVCCCRTHFQGDTTLTEDAGNIQEQIQLLERQLPVEVRGQFMLCMKT